MHSIVCSNSFLVTFELNCKGRREVVLCDSNLLIVAVISPSLSNDGFITLSRFPMNAVYSMAKLFAASNVFGWWNCTNFCSSRDPKPAINQSKTCVYSAEYGSVGNALKLKRSKAKPKSLGLSSFLRLRLGNSQRFALSRSCGLNLCDRVVLRVS